MNHKITQVFVPASVSTSLGTEGLGKQVMGVYNASTFANNASATTPIDFIVAIGSAATGSKYGSFKSSVIRQSNIISTRKTSADTNVQQQITFIGYDEITATKTPNFACDEEYFVTFKIDEYWSKGIYQPLIQESVRVRTTSCSECGGGCDSLNCYSFMQELTDKINANVILSKYLTASHSIVGTAPSYRYVLNLPDPGNSTAEGNLLTALQAYYPSGTYGTITETNTEDADAVGQIFFIIATPLVAIDAMPTYNGIAWEKQLVSAGSVTSCGIKVTGKAVDAFGNACVPDAVPYVFNLVKFQAKVHRGPFSSMDFDIEDFTNPWSVTTVQNIKYAVGVGSAMAEFERNHFTNNLPATADARYYWNPIYNEDANQYLYVNTANTYDMYEITYLEDSPVGFEKKTRNTHSLVILADSTVTAAVATALNNVLPASLDM